MTPGRCPECGSTETQAVQRLVDSGLLALEAQLAGPSGDSPASRLDPGPEPRKDRLGGCLGGVALLGSILLLGIGHWGWALLALGLAGFGAMAAVGEGLRVHRARVERERRLAYARQAWFCHRCGHDWVPATGGPAAVPPAGI